MINTIILGHALNILPKLPAESVSCVTCSPPYWGLRDYGIEPVIWDGDKNCKHIWGNPIMPRGNKSGKPGPNATVGARFAQDNYRRGAGTNFCSKCNAWRGSLGLEPTFELYIKHLCDIFDEVKRVLRKDGTCFINIGDSYGGSGNASGHKEYTKNLGYKTLEMGATQGNQRTTGRYAKSLLDIPYRFSIEMINRGWTKRNTLIWWKPNCMPASADDRFTVDFEYIFFFTKNNKTLFWTNEKTLECVSKNPLGTKGIEDKDWEWRPCPACSNKDYFNVRTRTRDIIKKEKDCPQFKASKEEKENIKNKICPRCKGLKEVKYSFWSGHDYWFEQQFEEYAPDTLPRMDRGININKWTLGADGQTPHNLSQPRLNKKRGYKTKQPEKEIQGPQHHDKDISYGKHGRNKRCVWKISTKSFKEAHFATFPGTLIEPIIKAGCPEFVCKKCGKARVKIYKFTGEYERCGGKDSITAKEIHKVSPTSTLLTGKRKINKEIGYTDCGCNTVFENGIVLDPFMGAGTTALVALKQRKRFIGIEIKQEYIEMAEKRIRKVQQELI